MGKRQRFANLDTLISNQGHLRSDIYLYILQSLLTLGDTTTIHIVLVHQLQLIMFLAGMILLDVVAK